MIAVWTHWDNWLFVVSFGFLSKPVFVCFFSDLWLRRLDSRFVPALHLSCFLFALPLASCVIADPAHRPLSCSWCWPSGLWPIPCPLSLSIPRPSAYRIRPGGSAVDSSGATVSVRAALRASPARLQVKWNRSTRVGWCLKGLTNMGRQLHTWKGGLKARQLCDRFRICNAGSVIDWHLWYIVYVFSASSNPFVSAMQAMG
jgi:hypothetical protein